VRIPSSRIETQPNSALAVKYSSTLDDIAQMAVWTIFFYYRRV
jgi:hypothetical protein